MQFSVTSPPSPDLAVGRTQEHGWWKGEASGSTGVPPLSTSEPNDRSEVMRVR